MAWPDFRYNQTDLAGLSVSPAVPATEYHSQNEHYGFHRLLKDYAGLPIDEALPWAMEHTITFEDPECYKADIASRLPIVLAVSEGQAEILKRHTRARVEAIGSSFFYMRARGDAQDLQSSSHSERRGTLVFPDKSTLGKDTDFDRERFARDLMALPDEFQPVAVSVGWRDIQRGVHAAFKQAGLMLVTSGHPQDPLFLFRQYDLCRRFRYAAANDISTSFCMSVLAGCRFFYLPTGPIRITEHGVASLHEQEPTLWLPAKQKCLEASRFPPVGDGSNQLALAEYFAGKSSLRPPQFFRDLAIEGRRLLQAALPPSTTIKPGQHLEQLAAWLTNGIDSDGWAGQTSALQIPARADHAVRLSIQIPASQEWRATWRLSWDGHERATGIFRRGNWSIDVPCRRDGAPRRIEIKVDGEFPLQGEERRRSFRLAQIQWTRSKGSNSEAATMRRIPAWTRFFNRR